MVILLLTLVSLLVLPYDTLLPVFAKVIFKGDAETFGYINSFIGLGALGSTFFLASLKPGADLKRTLLVNTIIFGVILMLFSHIGYFPPAMLFAALGGFGIISQSTISLTILQVDSAPNIKLRVITIASLPL